MQFQKNTSIGRYNAALKILIKISIVFVLLFLGVILIDKIELPAPYKKIEKNIPNEDLKIVK